MMKNLKKMMEALRQLLKKGENPLKKRNLNHQLRIRKKTRIIKSQSVVIKRKKM